MKKAFRDKSTIAKIVHVLDISERILLIAHVHPDPDAIGSILGMNYLLKSANKQPFPVVEGGCPANLLHLSGSSEILAQLPESQAFDLVIAMDSDDLSVLGNTGKEAAKMGVPMLVIDHHNYNEHYGTFNIVDSAYVSTTELIYDLAEYMHWSVSAECAHALLLGIMSDTQLFRLGPIEARTFEIVRELMLLGADYSWLIEHSFTTIEPGYLKLTGHVLSKAVLEDNVFWTWTTPQDFLEFGLKNPDKFFIVDELIKDENAHAAAVFRLMGDGKIRISMRARNGYDVGKIADLLGGGGHTTAAGCTLQGKMEDVIKQVTALLKQEASG